MERDFGVFRAIFQSLSFSAVSIGKGTETVGKMLNQYGLVQGKEMRFSVQFSERSYLS